MYDGKDYSKHCMSPRAKGFASVVIRKLASGAKSANGSFFCV